MAIDSAGALHVIGLLIGLGEPDKLQHVVRSTDGTWSEPMPIAADVDAGTLNGTSLAVDSTDELHVAWVDHSLDQAEIFYITGNGSTWSDQANVSQTEEWSIRPVLVAGPENTLHLAWLDEGAEDASGRYLKILYTRKPPDEQWSIPIDISLLNDKVNSLDLAVDRNGDVHVVWYDDSSRAVYYTRTEGDRTWTQPILMVQGGGNSPRIANDPEDGLHVIWIKDGNIWYTYTTELWNVYLPLVRR